MYLMYHEELESLARHLPEIERIRFWMTFGDQYLKHLEVLQNVGMTRSIGTHEGREIIRCNSSKRCCPSRRALADDEGQDQYRRHRDGDEGRRAEDRLRLQYLR